MKCLQEVPELGKHKAGLGKSSSLAEDGKGRRSGRIQGVERLFGALLGWGLQCGAEAGMGVSARQRESYRKIHHDRVE